VFVFVFVHSLLLLFFSGPSTELEVVEDWSKRESESERRQKRSKDREPAGLIRTHGSRLYVCVCVFAPMGCMEI